MNIAIVYNTISNEPEAILGINTNDKAIGYITNNNELENILEIILDNKELDIQIQEKINDSQIIRYKIVSYDNNLYLVALNYYLPHPYRILKVMYMDGKLDDVLQDAFNLINEEWKNE